MERNNYKKKTVQSLSLVHRKVWAMLARHMLARKSKATHVITCVTLSLSFGENIGKKGKETPF